MHINLKGPCGGSASGPTLHLLVSCVLRIVVCYRVSKYVLYTTYTTYRYVYMYGHTHGTYIRYIHTCGTYISPLPRFQSMRSACTRRAFQRAISYSYRKAIAYSMYAHTAYSTASEMFLPLSIGGKWTRADNFGWPRQPSSPAPSGTTLTTSIHYIHYNQYTLQLIQQAQVALGFNQSTGTPARQSCPALPADQRWTTHHS